MDVEELILHSDTQSREPVDRREVEESIRKLLVWVGEDPTREGLRDTPRRVADAFLDYCEGYRVDPRSLLERTFEEVNGYHDIVVLQDIRFESMCEHHLAPVIGKAHVAYLPKSRVVGISKLARVVECFARRLQIQERMTCDIAETIYEVLDARGAACIIEASHFCMKCRGVRKESSMTTQHLLGAFVTDRNVRGDFHRIVLS